MKLLVNQITESPKEVRFAEPIGEINKLYPVEGVRDFRFPPFLDVSLTCYRAGREVFFHGWFEGNLEGTCSRCLKSYSFFLEKKFDFVLTRNPLLGKNKELNRDEMGLSFYAAEEIDLAPFIREQVLLALPMRPLCEDSCRGLCGSCGANLNEEPCLCDSSPNDPRLALFRNLKLGQ